MRDCNLRFAFGGAAKSTGGMFPSQVAFTILGFSFTILGFAFTILGFAFTMLGLAFTILGFGVVGCKGGNGG